MKAAFIALAALLAVSGGARAETPLVLFAAGSLKAVMAEIAGAYAPGVGVLEMDFAPSGLLRKRIEHGEKADVFASANMAHPRALQEAGLAGPVTMFARNELCAIVQPGMEVSSDTLLQTMLDPEIRVGTSTPKADPAGDYAFELFGKADALSQGATKTLTEKALQLTGGPDSAKPPEGRNPYGWVMGEGKADVFLTYCTNARLARQDVPGLQIVPVPAPLAVGADYGLTVVDGAPAVAEELVAFILSPEAQMIFQSHGFSPPAN